MPMTLPLQWTKTDEIFLGYMLWDEILFVFFSRDIFRDINWVVPPPSNSHHQDYCIFRLGDPNLNLHLPLASWEGATPKISKI